MTAEKADDPGSPAGPGPVTMASLFQSGQDAGSLPLAVQFLLRPDTDYAARLAEIRRLPAHLSEAEVDGLFVYLRSQGPREGLLGMQERMLKSFVMDLLIKQPGPLDRIANGLASVSRDANQDAIVREYAVLYLGFCFSQTAESARGTIHAALADAAAEPPGRIRNAARRALR